MSEPAHDVCLYIYVRDELSVLSRIVDRLSVLGAALEQIIFRRGSHDRSFVHLHFRAADDGIAQLLAARLDQLVSVKSVRYCRSE